MAVCLLKNCQNWVQKVLFSNGADTTAPMKMASSVTPALATTCRPSERSRNGNWMGWRSPRRNTSGASAAHVSHWIIDQRRYVVAGHRCPLTASFNQPCTANTTTTSDHRPR